MAPGQRPSPRLAIYRHLLLSRADRFIALQAGQFLDTEVRLFGVERSSELPLELPHWRLTEQSRMPSLALRRYQLARRSRRLLRALAAWDPMVIVAHYAQDGWRIAPTARALGVPLVVICHGSDVLYRNEAAAEMSWSARQLRRNWDRLVEAVDLFLPVSRFVGRALAERGVPPDKIRVHYLGTSIPPQRPQAGDPDRQFLFVGRLEENKGCADLLDAFDKVRRGLSGVRLKIVGDGAERRRLESKARDLGLTREDVEFTGYLDEDGVAAAIEESAVVCVPSVHTSSGISEGLGLVALEAQVRERPVIAYRTGGLTEAVEDGTGGVLVPTGDRGLLGDAMGELISDPGRCRELGRRGRRFVEARFDSRTQTRLLERQLLERYGAWANDGRAWPQT
jgi:glycosyltransferase involved in cell wall biosynthesis